MSSIKQVQDLQSQLAELRQENTTLRTRFPDRDPSEREGGSAKNRRVDKQVQQTKAPQKISPPLLRDFDHVRKNIKLHSTGIFGFPSTDHSIVETATNVASRPELPSRTHFAHLSRAYLDTIHESFPVLHWPIFQHEVDQAYTARTLQGLPRPWIGLFFAVLACGTLQSSPGAQGLGSAFYEASSGALAPPSQYTTMEHIQGAFLLSIFATESGMKSAGSIWLASAVRMGQIIGLDKDIDRSLFEVEMRRRLWWSIRSWDRISSSNTNLPMLVVGDTDMPLPSSLEDRYIQRQGYTRLPTTQSPSTRFVALFDVASILSTLANALRSSMITRTSLQSYDDLFHSKSMNLQGSCHPESDAPIEPAALPILITLQFARFLLYRRNLSPTCQPADRLDALQRCSSVARNTATYISRTLAATPAEKDWRLRIGLVASNMMCTHLWRCTLMLCLRAEYEAALMCVKTSSAIGDIRQVNVACGKNLAFFLECLLDRVHSGNGSVHQLEHDEEMLAYVSGDLQGDREQAWVWNDSDLRSDQITNPSVRPRSMQRRGSDEQMQDSSSLPLRSVPTSPESGAKGWDGWARIERMIRQLEEYRARLAQPSPYYPPPHNPVKRVQLAPGAPASPPSSGPQVPSSSTSRISIANII
ncbi:hypothetical protein K491DRAFT_718388 [Lophiostoma macrostomum CBS 122681]|uniref:Xylanolytic transcriptional activator regulatory domain-containing protein n=1 Tax=Lophiostoma macrostomum CBS 122681 TaxID=1314788 RepID=A0A6A6SZC7_9PLEO|nr:hypothetical protein K491DRAFT_718388 [Lophiostoma macrostomum CBS 122681]